MLRDYQQSAVDQSRAALSSGYKKIIIVAPTGAGKSHITAEIIRLAVARGKKVVWLVHRRNLVRQFAETLMGYGVDPGVVMSGEAPNWLRPVQIGTIQTFARLGTFDLPGGDLCIVDEAHRSISPSYMQAMALYPLVIGTTATPCRSDGRGMGEAYQHIIDVISTRELTVRGLLAPVRYFIEDAADISGVRTRGDDYIQSELSRALDQPKIIGNIIETYLRIGEGRKGMIFAPGVPYSQHLCAEACRRGVPSAHVDARTPDAERDRIFNAMECGDMRLIFNVGVYREGMDVPDISYIGIPHTKSLSAYWQMVGRGLRVSPGKTDLILADHGGVVEALGDVDDEVIWTLDGKEKAWSKPVHVVKEKKEVVCVACNRKFKSLPKCPDCGSPVRSFGKKVEFKEADLVERGAKKKATDIDKRMYYGMMKNYCRKRGWKEGAAAHRFRERFGVWPNKYKHTAEIKPDEAFMNQIKYETIKWAKSRKKANHESA